MFENEKSALYGRQLPFNDARHCRPSFLQLSPSRELNVEDKKSLGIKAPFMSNSFAAYKRSALEKVGWFAGRGPCGFKKRIIMGEDTCAGAKLLMAGYKIAYVADALVYHFHNYTAFEEFKRYFDIGVFHRLENWLLKEFGSAEGEGLRYLKSELQYLIINRLVYLIPESFFRIGLKYLGYKTGNIYRMLPNGFRKLVAKSTFGIHNNQVILCR